MKRNANRVLAAAAALATAAGCTATGLAAEAAYGVGGNGKAIMDVAKENKHVKVMVRKGMDHDPFWTREGEKYYLTLIKGKNSFTSREREKNVVYDRRLLTENDEEVLKAVNDFLAR